MGYKQELLQKIQNIKDFMKDRNQDVDGTLKVDRLIKVYEDVTQVNRFFNTFNLPYYGSQYFGSKEKYDEFMDKNQGLFKGKSIPNIHPNLTMDIKIPDVDFEAVINAIEESSVLDEAQLEEVYKEGDPKIRAFNLPLTDVVNNIKADADALFEPDVAKELKNSLDFANGEMIQKIGKNLVDNAIEANSVIPMIHGHAQFKEFVKSKGLDENVVVNHSGGFLNISPDLFYNTQNIHIYRPFLDMKVEVSEDYQQKIHSLGELVEEQGLLANASGGESGSKEYGLADYFAKQRTLKKALVDYAKLQNEDEKREALINIDRLSKETKEITERYDKVLTYIKENFDLDNISLPGNLYGGRAGEAKSLDLENWYPDLPQRYDFENAKAVVFLNGFTQVKAACQAGDVTVEEYLANPTKAYLKGCENIGKKEDAKFYLPRGENNPLGKRLARTLAHRPDAYNALQGYQMIGGRAMEFITNTSSNKENQVNNVIVSNIVKEHDVVFNHRPERLFGNPDEPKIDNIKNLFAFASIEDDLYKVSDCYRDNKGDLAPYPVSYEQALQSQANVSIEDQYRNLMAAFKDFALDRKYMSDHLEEFGGRDKTGNPIPLTCHSLGTVIAAGRDYFEDCMLAHNLSIASIADDALREEVTSFMVDPVGTLMKNYLKEGDLAPEELEDVKDNCATVFRGMQVDEGKDFFAKFNQYNQKENGYNAGKAFSKCLDDNKGSWWERLRGKTSKQYNTLQKLARESVKGGGNMPGDSKALYSAAIAYKNYKMPEGGRTFEQLNSTEKRRIEFCDSIIEAYKAQKREAEAQNEAVAENNNAPQQQADNNLQQQFQNQLNQDLEPNNNIQNDNVEEVEENVNQKDQVENEVVEP